MILLDTHVLVWLVLAPEKLTRAAGAAIRKSSAQQALAVSCVTLYELGRLLSDGRIESLVDGKLADKIQAFVDHAEVAVRDVTAEVAAQACHFGAGFPSDPFDRLIAATAYVERVALVTADERIRGQKMIRTLW